LRKRITNHIGRRDLRTAGLPVMNAVLALGRVSGLTGKDEVIWLRACLTACSPLVVLRLGLGLRYRSNTIVPGAQAERRS
jgi:hypothetical protein